MSEISNDEMKLRNDSSKIVYSTKYDTSVTYDAKDKKLKQDF